MHRNRWTKRSAALALVVGLAACGSTARVGDPTVTTTASGRGAGRGWLDPEPKHKSTDRERGTMEAASSAAATTAAASSSARDSAAAGTVSAPAPPADGRPLRAGNIDDNATFDEYLAYRTRVKALGVPYRELDPTGRIVVKVTGSDGLPAAGKPVTFTQGGTTVATLTTTADGTVRLLPRGYDGDPTKPYTATVDGRTVETTAGAMAGITIPSTGAPDGAVKLDVVFLLDTTGSMGDEIDRLKTTIHSVADRLAALPSKPDLRIGMTIYRDLGDDYVTRTFDLTDDVGAFTAALDQVEAAGGGDTPEALDEALADALAKPAWRTDALGLVFLVADAAPHVERQVKAPYTDSIRAAAARGIKVFPVASSNTDDAAEFAFRQIAQATGARFVFLSYGASGAAVGEGSDIDSTDYTELPLDGLVVRLVADELAARVGASTPQLPPPASTTTTRPPGQ